MKFWQPFFFLKSAGLFFWLMAAFAACFFHLGSLISRAHSSHLWSRGSLHLHNAWPKVWQGWRQGGHVRLATKFQTVTLLPVEKLSSVCLFPLGKTFPVMCRVTKCLQEDIFLLLHSVRVGDKGLKAFHLLFRNEGIYLPVYLLLERPAIFPEDFKEAWLSFGY